MIPDIQGSERTGYLSAAYADSLAEFGAPLQLVRSGGWILKRAIPGTSDEDATSCYPLFLCRDWKALADDLHALDGQVVTMSAVTDPFGGYDNADLRRAFRDVVKPFKEHWIVDLRDRKST